MKRVVIAAAVGIVLGGSALLVAQTPFGGDDTGLAPPDKATRKCEDGVAKSTGKLVASLIKCHIALADGKITDDEACESAAASKFTSKTKTTGCHSCTNLSSIATTVTSIVDANNNAAYCAGSTPFGGDDTGNVPPDKATGKCEDGVAKGAGKLAAAIIGCHIKRADGKLADDTAEDACETAANTKFTTKTKTTGCGGCTNLGNIATTVETQADAGNQLAYCASPSGAFLN